MKPLSYTKSLKDLQIPDFWIELSILDQDTLRVLHLEWESSTDKNTEHYRWRAFKAFMANNILEPNEILDKAFAIARTEADQSLRSAMFHQIAKHSGCTTSILEEIVQIGDKSSRGKAALILESRKPT